MKRFSILITGLIFLTNIPLLYAEDSLKVFPYKDFYTLILNHHPVVKQSQLLTETALKELRVARGGFDPKFDFDYTRKVFKGTTYYDYIDNGLKIPTWFGADVKSGFEKNSGIFVNPTNFTPPEGLWYLGLEFPIGQGMIIDERRAVVMQAKIATQISEAERIKQINKTLLNAAKDYWEWYYQFHRMKQMEFAYTLAETRFEGIKQRVLLGDLASIDSVEAAISKQERWLDLQKSINDFQNSEIMLSNYLWTDKAEPLQIVGMKPEEPSSGLVNDSLFNQLASYAKESHPDLIKMNYKINQLKIDKRLKQNNLLPGFSVGMKYLSTPNRNLATDLNYPYISNNYKIMVSLTQPLFLRKERGKYELSKIKILQAEYERKIATREINNAIASAYNDVITYKELIQFQQSIYTNTKLMFEGEKQRFDNGESTVFLVNSRETKMIESKIKVFELRAKLEKSVAYLYWTAGKFEL